MISRLKPILRTAAILLALIAPAMPMAQAQDFDMPDSGSSEGDPWLGYGALIGLGGLAVFIVCKSARRDLAG